jgi:DNA-binding response OmpR family regulator
VLLEVSDVVDSLVQELDPPAPTPVYATIPTAGHRPQVLVVEDHADLRDYLTRLIASDGWSVDAVPDVPSALRFDRVPDVVLSDVMLPGQSGLDLVRLMRSQDQWARVPVVLLTARSGPREVAEGLAAGADDYVSKPFEPVELLSRLRTHYELARERQRRLLQAEVRANNLEVAVATNRRIGMAVGVLMAREKVTSETAFQRLRQQSNRTNRKLRDVADEVVLTGDLPEVLSV